MNGTNTYWLTNSVMFNLAVTFNSNCIIKRAPGATLTAGGSGINDLVCNGTCSAPSIITSQDDNMYGEPTGSNCACIDTAVAFLDEVRGANVTGMNIRYAGTGIEFTGEFDDRNFLNCTIESCQTGAIASACNITIQNSALSCVATPTVTLNSGAFYETWGSTCKQVSFHGAAVAGMQALAQSHSPSTGLQLYNYSGNYPTNFPISYNTNCWIYGLKGLTSICVSNGTPGTGDTNPLWNQLSCVLITPKHALTVDHIDWSATNVLRFIGKSGAHYIATVTNQTTIRSYWNGDCKLLTLDRDLTNDVETARVLPVETYLKMTLEITNVISRNGCLSRYLPGIAINQDKGAYAEDTYLWGVTGGYGVSETASLWFPDWINGYSPRGGDSGHPIFTVIGNELALIGCWYYQDSIGPIFPTLHSTPRNGFNNLYGFVFSSTNTIVVEGVWRWNENTNPCSQQHQLSFFNSLGSNLASATVAAQTNLPWSYAGLSAWLILPGNSNTNYYFLSQENAGGDYWYDWHGTTINNSPADFIVQGAAWAANSYFTAYTNYATNIGSSYVPINFTYYVYPHSGIANMPGAYTNDINSCLSTNGGSQYTVTLFDLSTFPNSER